MNPPAHALRSSASSSLLKELGADVAMPVAAPVIAEQTDSSSTYSPGVTSPTEQKALNLLGSGIGAEQVAAALGVTPGRISQLLSKEAFAESVAALRYENLQQHNVRDGAYDSLEDELIQKLNRALPLMLKPETILRAIAVVNSAKRRGQSAPEQVINQQNIVTIVLPKVVAAKFAVNIDNQVTKAGEQELVTMQSGSLLKRAEAATEQRLEEARALEHAPD